MPVVGVNLFESAFTRADKVQRVVRPHEYRARQRSQGLPRLFQQAGSHRRPQPHIIPQILLELQANTLITNRVQSAFAQFAMQHRGQFNLSDGASSGFPSRPNQRAHCLRPALEEIRLRNVG